MKTILTAILFALFSFAFTSVSFAQSPTLSWGPEYEDNGAFVPRIIHANSSGFITVSDGLGGRQILRTNTNLKSAQKNLVIFLEKYDHKLKKIKSVQIEFDDKNEQYEYTVATKGGQIYIISSIVDDKINSCSLYIRQVDPIDLSFPKKGQRISKSNYDHYKRPIYKFYQSEDSSKIAIVDQAVSNDKICKITIYMVDQEFNMLSNKSFDIPYKMKNYKFANSYGYNEDFVKLINLKVDESGNIYFVEKIYHEYHKGVDDWLKGLPNYHFSVFVWKTDMQTPNEFSFEDGTAYTRHMNIGFNGSKVHFVGLRANVGSNQLEVFSSVLDNRLLKLSEEWTQAVRHEEFTPVYSAKKEKKHFKDMMELMNSGSTIEISEIRFREEEISNLVLIDISYHQNFSSYTYIDNHGQSPYSRSINGYEKSLLSVNMGAKREITAYSFISLRQSAIEIDLMYLSYVLSSNFEGNRFIFHESKRTDYFRKEKVEEPTLIIVSEKNGESTTESITTPDKKLKDYTLVPVYSRKLSDDKMLLLFHGKKKHRYAILEY